MFRRKSIFETESFYRNRFFGFEKPDSVSRLRSSFEKWFEAENFANLKLRNFDQFWIADNIKMIFWRGGQLSTIVSILASRPSSPGYDSQRSQTMFKEKIVDVAEVKQWPCLEESGQWLENVHHTHLVLASSKQVLQKRIFWVSIKLPIL